MLGWAVHSNAGGLSALVKRCPWQSGRSVCGPAMCAVCRVAWFSQVDAQLVPNRRRTPPRYNPLHPPPACSFRAIGQQHPLLPAKCHKQETVTTQAAVVLEASASTGGRWAGVQGPRGISLGTVASWFG